MIDNKWFCIPRPVKQPKLRLFCFPYAGGNATTYYPWAELLNPEIELVAIQPPGRSNRMNEVAHCNMHHLISDLIQNIVPLLNVPFIFFGHSLGSRIAYELATRLEAHKLPVPEHLFASGSGAPHIVKRKRQLHKLSDIDFINELQKLNGTPGEILRNKDLMQIFLPLLRADFQISDTYLSEKIVLNFPFTILAGTEDHSIEPRHLESWKELTSFPCETLYIPGDHFFIETNKNLVFHTLCEILELDLIKKPFEC